MMIIIITANMKKCALFKTSKFHSDYKRQWQILSSLEVYKLK